MRTNAASSKFRPLNGTATYRALAALLARLERDEELALQRERAEMIRHGIIKPMRAETAPQEE